MKKKLKPIQFISQGHSLFEQQYQIQKACDAGVEWIQIRWKDAPKYELYKLCEFTKLLGEQYQSLIIINDHIALAKEFDLDGVHLGLQDDEIPLARMLLGNHKIIGGTANTYDDVLRRHAENCDYIGLGPLRFTATKQSLSPVLGLDGYKEIVKKLNRKGLLSPPIYAIGGIQLADISPLNEIGIHGVALSGLISNNPASVSEIKKILQ